MKQIFCFVFVAASLITMPSAACAKGSPDLIVITGGGLAQPIEITEHATLKSFDPWSGQFINWEKGPILEPTDPGSFYDVFFFMKGAGRHSKYDRAELQMIYSLRYCCGRDGGSGYVYLPGKGYLFLINTGTILREGNDGKGHQASAAWDSVMKRLLCSH